MAPSLLHPPSHLSPAAALQLSQQAPAVLQNSPSTISSAPLADLFSTSESADLWLRYENLLLSCLRTGDEHAAHQCLERLVARFGDNNERVMALKGLVKEADASHNGDLEKVLREYDSILAENSTNIVSACLVGVRWEGEVANRSPAYRETSDRTATLHGPHTRGSRVTDPVPRLCTNRSRSLVRIGRPLPDPGHISTGHIRPGRGPIDGTQRMERQSPRTRPTTYLFPVH